MKINKKLIILFIISGFAYGSLDLYRTPFKDYEKQTAKIVKDCTSTDNVTQCATQNLDFAKSGLTKLVSDICHNRFAKDMQESMLILASSDCEVEFYDEFYKLAKKKLMK